MTAHIIGYAGMTHLGLNSAVAAADKGFEVVCYDPDPLLIVALNRHELPVVEPDLPELLEKNAQRISFTADPHELVSCDMVYVAPDVPTDDDGQSDLGQVDALISQVDAVLRSDAAMIILSQVPPGFTRHRLRAGRSLYYQVETLIFGRAVERALYPERFIVGCAEPKQPLAPVFAHFLGSFGCPILPMRYESAELAKISINMCLVASVSVANTLAEICERIGADWSEIVPALKLDRRIGAYAYLAAGLGIAGGNLERDLATVCHIADQHHTDAGMVRACIENSRHRKGWAARTIRSVLLDAHPDATVAVWGLAYKENTHSVKNSPSLETIAQLPGVRLKLHDPLVPASATAHARAEGTPDPLAAARNADALMILTPWPQYRAIAPADIAAAMRGRIVLDPYGVLDPMSAALADLDLFTLGRPPAHAAQ